MDLMEQLLCPQISMDVDETPLELDTTNDDKDGPVSEEDEPEIPDHIKIQILMENDRFDTSQTPETLTEEEEIFKKNLFSEGQAVQFMKLHCTSCNTHLGSSPIKQLERYIHPLLQVLMCKSCYDFYSSGDFDKDEDGSELYCRWCGQGGKVMCCSDCAFVFCQKCVRTNLGVKKLAEVKNSDDWRCLVCNPQQMMSLKVICQSLFDYTLKEIRLAKGTNDTSILLKDYALCCNKSKKVKRKRAGSPDETFSVNPADSASIISKRKKDVLRKALTSFASRSPAGGPRGPAGGPRGPIGGPRGIGSPAFRNILPAGGVPNPMFRMTGNQVLFPPGLAPLSRPQRAIAPNNNIRFTYVRNPQPRNPIILCTSTNRPVTPSSVQNRAPNFVPARGSQNFIPLNNNSVRVMSPQARVTPNQAMVNSVPARIQPGMRHIWYDRAAAVTSDITQNLSRKMAGYTVEQRNAKTVEELANVHNKLQELLSSSVNSLIQVRKSLRNEFLRDLNKLKQLPQRPLNNIQAPPHPPINISNDDDIILINNEENALPVIVPSVASEPKLLMTSPEITDGLPRTFLKVKPVSSLIDSSRLLEQTQPVEQIVTDNIDLCDDDDDDLPASLLTPVVSLDEGIEPVPSTSCAEPPTPDPKESEYDLPPVDEVTYRQIRRALAESKFESLLEQHALVKINPQAELSKSDVKRMLSVRVVLAPDFKTGLPDAVDFEEMLNSSIVTIPTAPKTTTAGDECVTIDSDDDGEDVSCAIFEKQVTNGLNDCENEIDDVIDLDDSRGKDDEVVVNNISSDEDDVVCNEEPLTTHKISDDEEDVVLTTHRVSDETSTALNISDDEDDPMVHNESAVENVEKDGGDENDGEATTVSEKDGKEMDGEDDEIVSETSTVNKEVSIINEDSEEHCKEKDSQKVCNENEEGVMETSTVNENAIQNENDEGTSNENKNEDTSNENNDNNKETPNTNKTNEDEEMIGVDKSDASNVNTSVDDQENCAGESSPKIVESNDQDNMETTIVNEDDEIEKSTSRKSCDEEMETSTDNNKNNDETDAIEGVLIGKEPLDAETNVDFKIMINEKRLSVEEAGNKSNPDAQIMSPPENLDDNALDHFHTNNSVAEVFNTASDPVTTTDSGIEIDAK